MMKRAAVLVPAFLALAGLAGMLGLAHPVRVAAVAAVLAGAGSCLAAALTYVGCPGRSHRKHGVIDL